MISKYVSIMLDKLVTRFTRVQLGVMSIVLMYVVIVGMIYTVIHAFNFWVSIIQIMLVFL
jgi:hypothetical protein